jgi:hypothetical protein
MPDPLEDTTALLVALVGRGFRFAHHRDAAGDLVAIQGVRVHDNVVDVVVLRGEDEAKAVRMPGDEPDILAPATTLWRTTGPAPTVLATLLNLPDELAPASAASSAREGCWVAARPGRAIWLRASTG